MRTPTIFGAGSVRLLPEIVRRHGGGPVLLVCGESAFSAPGVSEAVTHLARSLVVHRFSAFTSNPTIADVTSAIELLRSGSCRLVLGIGGGSAMDVAKAAAALADEPGDPVQVLHERTRLPARTRRLVLVPTTAGSGSEATSFAVIYSDGVKHSLDDPACRADAAVVDPDLTLSLPAVSAASAGLDALSQAIESFWSVRSTDRSRRDARAAAALAIECLEDFVTARSRKSRASMSRAALLAGRAIDRTHTTGPHAMSYGLTALFGVPHGHACALTLPAFLVFNAGVTAADVTDARGVNWVLARIDEILALFGVREPEIGRERLIDLVTRAGVPARLSDVGVGIDAFDALVARVDVQRAGNNPRRLTAKGLRKVLSLAA